MTVRPIEVGDEVTLRKVKDKPVGVVTYNTEDIFCVLKKDGTTWAGPRTDALPYKTGRHFNAVKELLKTISK